MAAKTLEIRHVLGPVTLGGGLKPYVLLLADDTFIARPLGFWGSLKFRLLALIGSVGATPSIGGGMPAGTYVLPIADITAITFEAHAYDGNRIHIDCGDPAPVASFRVSDPHQGPHVQETLKTMYPEIFQRRG